MKIAITGHRPDKLGYDYELTGEIFTSIKSRLQSIIDEYKPTCLITGMALGVDTLWAIMAIENRIPFIAALPCQNQSSTWPEKSKAKWLELTQHELCEVVYVSNEKYAPHLMQKRNEWMVNNSDLLVAVWDGSEGGTSNCVRYALANNRKVIHVNPKILKLI